MIDLNHFSYNTSLDLTAASIGISNSAWDCINLEDDIEASRIMQGKRYDVLPVRDEKGQTTKYYCTRVRNDYTKLNLNNIVAGNHIYYRTSFHNLVRAFRKQNCHYFFLTDYTEIVGLVSISNLNCRAVYIQLYQIIGDLETSVAQFLNSNFDPIEIVSVFENLTDPISRAPLDIYREAQSQGVEGCILEFTYLQHLGILIDKLHHRFPNSKQQLQSFYKKFAPNGTFGALRNKIMHPVKPLVSDTQAISDIDDLLSDIKTIKEILAR